MTRGGAAVRWFGGGGGGAPLLLAAPLDSPGDFLAAAPPRAGGEDRPAAPAPAARALGAAPGPLAPAPADAVRDLVAAMGRAAPAAVPAGAGRDPTRRPEEEVAVDADAAAEEGLAARLERTLSEVCSCFSSEGRRW